MKVKRAFPRPRKLWYCCSSFMSRQWPVMYVLRLLAAFLISPLAGGLSFITFYPPIVYPAIFFSYFIGIICGPLVIIILHWMRLTAVRHYILSAAAIGSAPFIYLNLRSAIRSSDHSVSMFGLLFSVIGMCGGAVGGLVFWLVARPDRFEAERDLRLLIASENRRLRGRLRRTNEP